MATIDYDQTSGPNLHSGLSGCNPVDNNFQFTSNLDPTLRASLALTNGQQTVSDVSLIHFQRIGHPLAGEV
ncbi:hypothetical protein D3C85_1580590 [compost metagenome]